MRWASPVDGWCDEPREIGASLLSARRRREPLDILWREVVVFKTDTTRMQRMIVIALFQQLAVFFSAFMQLHGLLFLCLRFRKRNIDLLVTHFSRKRNLFEKKKEGSARNWNYLLYSGWLDGPGWPGKRFRRMSIFKQTIRLWQISLLQELLPRKGFSLKVFSYTMFSAKNVCMYPYQEQTK